MCLALPKINLGSKTLIPTRNLRDTCATPGARQRKGALTLPPLCGSPPPPLSRSGWIQPLLRKAGPSSTGSQPRPQSPCMLCS